MLLRWETAPDAASLAGEAENLVRLATIHAPSAVTPVLIEKLAEKFPNLAEHWRSAWQRMELRRAALRMVPRQVKPGWAPPPKVVVLPGTAESAMDLPIHDAASRPLDNVPQARGLEAVSGSVALISFRSPGEDRVLLEDELRSAFLTMQEKTRNQLPPWAGVNVRMKPESLERFSLLPMQLASLGGEIPDVLSKVETAHFILETGPREKDYLLRDYYSLLRWAAAVIGCAFLASALGLWLIRRTLAKERRLNELKSQFVSSVSHELRAPIGSMRLMAEGLASGKVTGPAADEFHRLMAGEGARLSSLIENVLDFARIEQGRKQYVMAETDIAALVNDAVKLMRPQAEARGLQLVTNLAPLPFVPKVDAGAILQALINLLDNAIKFSNPNIEPGSTPAPAAEQSAILISLTTDADEHSWSLAVRDHGIGIPKSEQTRIFERFHRLGNELRRETTGAGIGLAIVKHIVEGHGGKVDVESALGKGSAFTITFPKDEGGDQRMKDEIKG
jgi:signal transduction histidine kinase